jgi:autotransporter translocation and assembly factor TamB
MFLLFRVAGTNFWYLEIRVGASHLAKRKMLSRDARLSGDATGGHHSLNLRSGSWIGRLYGQVAWNDLALFYRRFHSMARVLGDWNVRLKAG